MISLWLAVVIVAVWFVKGVATSLRDQLAARVAHWLLPDDQPMTYRLAATIACLALAITPKRQRQMIRFSQSLTMDIGFAGERLGYKTAMSCNGPGQALWLGRLVVRIQENVLPFLESRGVDYAIDIEVFGAPVQNQWSRPEELLAELEADFCDKNPVDEPLSMALPVLVEAIQLRAQACGVALIAVVLAAVALTRSTRPVALLEAHLSEWRYPSAGVRSVFRSSATLEVLLGHRSIASAAKLYGVDRRAVRCWVRTAYRDAGRPQQSISPERFRAAEFAQKLKSSN